MNFKHLMLLAVSAALFACSHTEPLTGPTLAVTRMTELPPPGPEYAEGVERRYRIGPFDKVEVDVLGVTELSRREVQADSAGRLAFPLVGSIDANGKTPDELSQEIAARLRGRFVRNPNVTVNMVDTVSQAVTVDGEVRTPGRYPVVGRLTLMRAVAQAQGLSEFARQRDVVIFRTVGDQKMAALYDLGAIRAGRYADPEIFPDDVILVGTASGRRLFRDLMTIAPSIISAPLIALIQPR